MLSRSSFEWDVKVSIYNFIKCKNQRAAVNRHKIIRREKYVIDTIINRLDCYLTTMNSLVRLSAHPFNATFFLLTPRKSQNERINLENRQSNMRSVVWFSVPRLKRAEKKEINLHLTQGYLRGERERTRTNIRGVVFPIWAMFKAQKERTTAIPERTDKQLRQNYKFPI